MAQRQRSAESAIEAAPPQPGPAGDAQQFVLVSAVKNEAPFLLEWVAYHKRIGFTKIVILSNTSSDGTEDILAALAAAGEIVHYHVDPRRRQSPQGAAVRMFETKEGYQDGCWYLWLDADEFLNIHVGARKVSDLIASLGPCSGINLNWRLFGTSGHERFPGRFVSRHFPGATSQRFGANRETKTLFQKSPDITGFAENAIYRPRLTEGHSLAADRFMAGNGAPMLGSSAVTKAWLAGDRVTRTNIVGTREMGWALAQINHYSVRTPEFFGLKKRRGRGAGKLRLKNNSRHNDDYFQKFNINGAKDISIAAWEDEVSDEIGRMLNIPSIAEAVSKSEGLVQNDLEEAAAASDLAKAEVGPPQPAPKDASQIVFKLTFPAAERAVVETAYHEAQTILEYGSGGSTVLAAKGGSRVFTVESDREWARQLAVHLADFSDKVHVHYADIGPTGDWGRPLSTEAAKKFHRYALSVWDRPDFVHPDLVLIDGRFRAACIVAVRMRATRPVTVLFDDYADRRYYHRIERLAAKHETIGRMARFTVTPGPIPSEMITEAIGWFADSR